MEYKKTAFHCEAGVATITMDCPENLNAIDVDMAKELLERLYQCDRSSEVKVVVLKGGVRAFSAGGDIRYLYDNIQRGVVESSELVVLVGKLALVMKQLNKLVICAVSGSAAGAGANLALSGDFVVCSGKRPVYPGVCGHRSGTRHRRSLSAQPKHRRSAGP